MWVISSRNFQSKNVDFHVSQDGGTNGEVIEYICLELLCFFFESLQTYQTEIGRENTSVLIQVRADIDGLKIKYS